VLRSQLIQIRTVLLIAHTCHRRALGVSQELSGVGTRAGRLHTYRNGELDDALIVEHDVERLGARIQIHIACVVRACVRVRACVFDTGVSPQLRL
jgi:hypothetical protein